MLQALREKTSGWFSIVLLSILAGLLVISGLQGYVYTSADTAVAKIGDTEVTPKDFDVAFSRAREQALQMGQTAKQFDTPEQRRKVLDALVDQKLLEKASKESGLLLSDQSVQQQIALDPTFQTDGKFDRAKYTLILQQARLSEAQVIEIFRSQHAQSILSRGIFGSSFVTDTEINDYLKLRDQTRNFRYISIEPNELAATAAPSDADVKKYYDENASKYMSADSADVEYVRIVGANMTPVAATDEMLRADYDKQAGKFKSAEQRQAAHILIEVDGGSTASADKQKAAQTEAQALTERARKGEDFAALANQYSKDLGSSTNGGDLGFADNGANEPAFDTKLFAMKVGETSDPVLTSAGYHVIKLLAIEPEKGKKFEEVREELLSAYNERALDVQFNKIAGEAYNAAQADPRSLIAVAKAANITTQRTGMITKAGGSDPVTSNREFLDAVFSDAVFKRGNNTQLITIGKNDQVIARVAVPKASALRPLLEVKADVEFAIRTERQNQAMKDRAAELLKKINAGQSLDALATELNKTIETADGAGRNAANRDPALTAEVFKAARPAAGKPTRFSALIGSDKIALIELASVTDGNPASADKATRDSVRDQLRFERAAAEVKVLTAALKQNHEIVLHEDRTAPTQ